MSRLRSQFRIVTAQLPPRCPPGVAQVSPRCRPGVAQVLPRCRPGVAPPPQLRLEYRQSMLPIRGARTTQPPRSYRPATVHLPPSFLPATAQLLPSKCQTTTALQLNYRPATTDALLSPNCRPATAQLPPSFLSVTAQPRQNTAHLLPNYRSDSTWLATRQPPAAAQLPPIMFPSYRPASAEFSLSYFPSCCLVAARLPDSYCPATVQLSRS